MTVVSETIAPPLSATGEELEEPGEEADRYTVGREAERYEEEAGRTGRFTRARAEETQQPVGGPTAHRDNPGGER